MPIFAVASVSRARNGIEKFMAGNPGFPVGLVAGHDPEAVGREDLVATGLITRDNRFDAAALAQAMSHVALWRHCAEQGDVMHIADVRSVVRHDFAAAIGGYAAHPDAFDVLVWGVDMVGPVQIGFAPGVEGRLIHDETQAPPDIGVFQACQGGVLAFALRFCGAPVGYTLTPAGARALLARCLPFGGAPLAYFGAVDKWFANEGFDREMARQYPHIRAFIAQPLLGVMPVAVPAKPVGEHFLNAFYSLGRQPRIDFAAMGDAKA